MENRFGLNRATRFVELAHRARLENEKQQLSNFSQNDLIKNKKEHSIDEEEGEEELEKRNSENLTSISSATDESYEFLGQINSAQGNCINNHSSEQCIKLLDQKTPSKVWKTWKFRTNGINHVTEQPKMVKVVTTAKTVDKASKTLQNLALRKRLKQRMRKIAEERLTVKQIFRRYVEQSTLHGFRYTCSDTYFIRRFIWAVLMILGAIYFIVKLKEGILEYFSYPFSTLSTLEYVETLTLPAISICTINQFRYSRIIKSPLKQLLDLHRIPFSNNWTDPGFDIKGSEFVDEIRNISFQIEEIFKECDYIRRDTDHPSIPPRNCSAQNFTSWFSQTGRLCFTLNSGQFPHKLLEVDHEGLKNGFEIMFDLQQFDVVRSSIVGGLEIMIHDHNEPQVRSTGFMISTGFKHFVSMQREETKNLPPPFATQCGEKQLKYYDVYNQKACLLEQLTDYVAKQCSCREPYMPENGLPYCSLRERILCVFPAEESFDEYEMRKECPIDCEIVSYKKRVSDARFVHNPPKGIEKPLLLKEFERKNMTSHLLHLAERYNETELDSYIEQNIIVVLFYFGEMSKLVHEQEASFDFYQFLGDMGGEIGLMLGASLLTFVEFVDLFWFLAYHQLLRLYKRKKEIYRQSLRRKSTLRTNLDENENKDRNSLILKNKDVAMMT